MVLNRLWDIWAGQVLSICVNDYLNLQLHLMDIETLQVLRLLRSAAHGDTRLSSRGMDIGVVRML